MGIHPDSRNSDDPWLITEVPLNEILRVLQVEGSILDASSSERVLAKAGYSLHCERVVNASEMRAALAREPWDVIISDYRLPQFDAPAALLLLHESGHDIPFIVVSPISTVALDITDGSKLVSTSSIIFLSETQR